MTNDELDNKFNELEDRINNADKLNEKLKRIDFDLETLSESRKEG